MKVMLIIINNKIRIYQILLLLSLFYKLKNYIMQTIAQQKNITDFPYREYNKKGNLTYIEEKTGFWIKQIYDESGENLLSIEKANGQYMSGNVDTNLHFTKFR